MYHHFTNLFSKLSESTFFTRKIASFSKKHRVTSIRLATFPNIAAHTSRPYFWFRAKS